MVKSYKYLLFTLAFTGLTKVDARIDIRSYGDDLGFLLFCKPEFSGKIPEQYSLFWGSALIHSSSGPDSGFLRNLRLLGNFKVEKDRRGTRDIHLGQDGVQALLIQLFPDYTSGPLVAEKTGINEKGQEIRRLAALLIKAEFMREVLRLKGNGDKEGFRKQFLLPETSESAFVPGISESALMTEQLNEPIFIDDDPKRPNSSGGNKQETVDVRAAFSDYTCKALNAHTYENICTAKDIFTLAVDFFFFRKEKKIVEEKKVVDGKEVVKEKEVEVNIDTKDGTRLTSLMELAKKQNKKINIERKHVTKTAKRLLQENAKNAIYDNADKEWLEGLADIDDLFSDFYAKTAGMKADMLEKAILSELEYGYPDRIVERIILAYISEILENQQDAALFYEIYSKYRDLIFSKSHNVAAIANLKGNSAAYIAYAACVSKDTKNVPYTNPVSNQSCPSWIRDGAEIKAAGQFADCVETSIRHVFNFVADQGRIPSKGDTSNGLVFDGLRERVLNEFRNGTLGTDRIGELEDFYTKTGRDGLNSGDSSVRGDWNKVVFGFDDNVNEVRYSSNFGLRPGGGNNLKSSIDNVVRVMCSVLGIKYDALKEGGPQDPKDFTVACFSKLLKILNPANDYNIEFYPDNDPDYGMIRITIIDGDQKSYSIVLRYKSGHGWAMTPCVSENVSLRGLREQTELVYFLFPTGSNNPYYQVFGKGTEPDRIKVALHYATMFDDKYKASFRRIANHILAHPDNVNAVVPSTFIQEDNDLSWCSSLINFRIDPQCAKGLVLPDSLKTLVINDNCSVYEKLVLPESLQSLNIGNVCIFQELDFEKFKSLKNLNIGSFCEFSKKVTIPESVMNLKIGSNIDFNGGLVLRNSLKTLKTCKWTVNGEFVLPEYLETLEIGSGCKFKELDFDELRNLIELKIGDHCGFSKKLTIPESVINLEIGSHIDFNGGLVLRNSLKTLSIDDWTVNGEFVLPESLKTLMIHGWTVSANVILPESLETLKIDSRCNFKEFGFEKLKNLRNLMIGGYCELSEKVTIPEGIKDLKTGSEIKFNGGLVLPESIETLDIGKGCKFKELDFEKSKNLKNLYIGESCEFSEKVTISEGLENLTIGNMTKFNGGLVLPESIETLNIGEGCKFKELDFEKSKNLEKLSIPLGCEFSEKVIIPERIKSLTICNMTKFNGGLVLPESIETLKIVQRCKFKELDFEKSKNLKDLEIWESCEFSEKVTIPECLENLTIRGDTNFNGGLTLPKSLETLRFDGGVVNGIFFPESLKTLHISRCNEFDFKKLKKIANIYTSCSEFARDVIFPEGLESLVLDRTKFNGEVVLPNSLKTLRIESSTVGGEFVLPELLETFELRGGCKFKKLNFEKLKNLKKKKLEISRCEFSEEVTIPECIEDLVIGFHNKFKGGLVLPSFLKTLVISCDGGFVLPESIETLEIGPSTEFNKLDFGKLKNLTNLKIFGCDTFSEKVTIPEGVKNLEIGYNAFCDGLVLPESVEALCIKGSKFKGLEFGKSTKLEHLKIDSGCDFSGDVVLPEGPKHFKISYGDFHGELFLPKSVETIEIEEYSPNKELNLTDLTKLTEITFKTDSRRKMNELDKLLLLGLHFHLPRLNNGIAIWKVDLNKHPNLK